MNWIQTYTGIAFDLDNPRPDMVNLFDIAHALSNLCRFGGHCKTFYSVAQHSVLASRYAYYHTKNEVAAKCVFLHDASEAYVIDVPRPVKKILGTVYTDLEAKVLKAILQHFALEDEYPKHLDIIKEFDERMLLTEKRDIMSACEKKWIETAKPFTDRIMYWSPNMAELSFLHIYLDLQ